MTKKALGRGLSALINSDSKINTAPAATAAAITQAEPNNNDANSFTVMLALDKLSPGRFQPREYFDEEKLKELTDSVRENGVLQPILVRTADNGKYQIVAGERRWRASKQAGLASIPAVIKELSDKEALEFALIENIQRQSLTPIEEAEGYQRLMDEFSYTQEQLASNLGKSRSHIANMLRLLSLPQEIKDMINSGSLTMGHARALIKLDNPEEVAHEIIRKGLSVREAEKFAAGRGKAGRGSKERQPAKTSGIKVPSMNVAAEKDDDLIAIENSLSDNLGLRVTVEDSEEGGKVTLYFNNLSELDRILQKLS